jgi:hypothetical protein
MAKRKPEVLIKSFGIYTQWDAASKELPRITEFTTRVRAELDVEFGFIVNIKGAKNAPLDYCIYHPDIPDADGNTRPPFDGTVFVKTNDWDFYLGDTIWAPVSNKLGSWRMTLELASTLIADKTFELYL